MGVLESAHIFGVQIRESANDGSDFSNADTDYRILFVGEDGLFHLKDASGTVTTPTGMADPMTTRGDIIIRDASNVTARLARGSAGQVFTSDGTDVAWATPATPALVRLAETVLGSNQAAITFTGISGAYRDLIITASLRSAKVAAGDDYRLRVGNGSLDTGTNYSYQFTSAGNVTISTAPGTTQSAAYFGNGASAGSIAGCFSFHEMTIRDYTSTARHRTMLGMATRLENSTDNKLLQLAGSWRNTSAAIDQVSVYADGGDLLTGSRVTLYGRG